MRKLLLLLLSMIIISSCSKGDDAFKEDLGDVYIEQSINCKVSMKETFNGVFEIKAIPNDKYDFKGWLNLDTKLIVSKYKEITVDTRNGDYNLKPIVAELATLEVIIKKESFTPIMSVIENEDFQAPLFFPEYREENRLLNNGVRNIRYANYTYINKLETSIKDRRVLVGDTIDIIYPRCKYTIFNDIDCTDEYKGNGCAIKSDKQPKYPLRLNISLVSILDGLKKINEEETFVEQEIVKRKFKEGSNIIGEKYIKITYYNLAKTYILNEANNTIILK